MQRDNLTAQGMILVVVGTLLAGSLASPSAAMSSVLTGAEQRGRQIATQRCSICHGIDQQAVSPRKRAPTFRSLAGRFVGLSLQQKLTEIGETGHYDMPPQVLHQDQIADLSAYLNSLERPLRTTWKHKLR